ncbi:hypothetical protein [Actinopolymorpha alba]|nr:hypothetical protein [Actinopolymorpha alba]
MSAVHHLARRVHVGGLPVRAAGTPAKDPAARRANVPSPDTMARSMLGG